MLRARGPGPGSGPGPGGAAGRRGVCRCSHGGLGVSPAPSLTVTGSDFKCLSTARSAGPSRWRDGPGPRPVTIREARA